ncbi:hypothetical protein N9D23_13745 [Rubripirellula sp.]|jgi:hypothetical protein|nr:hypothetical protein [Planctomycetaceae bacterium]MDA9859178.1 hypothetical protein [Rubripirellula sp.]MDF1844044.1 hypothetical protein [Rubripirellula sp.]
MPTFRFTAVFVFILLTASQLYAAGPFGRRRMPRSYAAPVRPAFSVPLSVLQSPKKMTELFGPSILVREQPAENPKDPRFVQQPSDTSFED